MNFSRLAAMKSPGKLKIDVQSSAHCANNKTVTNLTSTVGSTSAVSSTVYRTPNSIRKTRNGTFHSFPIVNTPTPPSRLRKIVNPFEVGITERLHLPLIESPSLFHRPATPQLCSTQLEFEWTIDEVSSLNPANVEAHETQFISVTDPEVEAKAQADIISYFKERIAVPSPDEVRDQKAILSSSCREAKPLLRSTMRDGCCQTELTLPPILPKEIEDALKPYFTFLQSQQQTPSKTSCDSNTTMNSIDAAIDHDARDASLRRKLFQTHANSSEHSTLEYEREVHLDSPPPQTPEMDLKNIRSRRFLTPRENEPDENKSPLNISLSPVKRESFGSISPITREAMATPQSSRKSLPSTRKSNHTSISSLFRSTPDRSSICRWKSMDISMDDRINCSNKRKSFHLSDDKSTDTYDTTNDANCSYEDEMQSSYGSQQHPQTPTLNKSKRRCNSVSRKNLSRSFNQIEEQQAISLLDKTDSGFNEINEYTMHSNFDELMRFKQQQPHQSMFRNAESPTFFNLSRNDCDVSMKSTN